MARPSKYNWEAIKEAYQDGVTIVELVKKYKVAKKTLENKISAEKWEVTGELNSHIEEFRESLGKISQNTKDDPIKQEIAIGRISTILEDNELISNDRKLLKAFQGLIGQGIRSGMYRTPQDIKAGTSAIKDIEAIVNPQTNKQEINIQNSNAVQTNIVKTLDDFYE